MILAQAVSIARLWPELLLTAAGCTALLLGVAQRDALRRVVPWLTVLALAVGILILRVPAWSGQTVAPDDQIHGGLLFDQLADFVRVSTLILGVLIVLVSWSQPLASERGEFFAMALFSLTGLMLVGSSANLVTLFLALELVSIPTYVMVVLSRTSPRALEAGTKYFYLGALSAAIMAYGFSFLYGVMGSATIDAESVNRLSAALARPGTLQHSLASIGLLLGIGGLLFKIGAVPLHFYIADVYEGAASPVAGLLGFVPKLAGFVAIFKVITLADWQTGGGGLFWLLWMLAAVSMTVGNVLALRQTSIKRMLAYSGIAHSGYMLVAVLAGQAGSGVIGDGPAAVLYYVVVYGIANLGAFALLGLLQVRGQPCETVRDIAGLLHRAPGPALLMALAMLTLMGMPPTPGFWGKAALFGSALAAADTAAAGTQSWIIGLVIIAALNTAIGAAYYLRVAAACLLYENAQPAEPAAREAQYMGALLCGFLLLFFSAFPGQLFNAGKSATGGLRAAPVAAKTTPSGPPSEVAAVQAP